MLRDARYCQRPHIVSGGCGGARAEPGMEQVTLNIRRNVKGNASFPWQGRHIQCALEIIKLIIKSGRERRIRLICEGDLIYLTGWLENIIPNLRFP